MQQYSQAPGGGACCWSLVYAVPVSYPHTPGPLTDGHSVAHPHGVAVAILVAVFVSVRDSLGYVIAGCCADQLEESS